MSLYKRKNSAVWWMDLRVNGLRQRISTGTENKKLAETIHGKALADIQEGRWFENQKAKSVTFRELAEKYMTKYKRERDPYTVKRLLPFFGEMTLASITPSHVEDYILERSEDQARPSTIYKEYALARRTFNIARKRWKWVSNNPFGDVTFTDLLKIDNARERWLTVEEEKILLAAATPAYLADIIIFALHTGCRRGEILSCEWKQNIDMQRRLVTMQSSKGGNRKTIPMSETLYQMLLRRSKVQDISGRVFPVEALTMKDAFERAVAKAGLQGFRFHDQRHTFATRLVQAGVDLYAVKQMMGHRSIKTTERYAHHYPESLRHTVKALDDCYKTESCHILDTVSPQDGCLNAEKSSKINYGSA